FQRKERFTR
ncbi:hypothetical protein CISIN_1g0194371mg, partial [Citrus sinensis]